MNRFTTYLLGAGASYHALPVVDGMNHRMLTFLEMFTKDFSGNSKSKNHINYYGDVDYRIKWKKYTPIIEEVCKHKTVDTYAKKLYLREEFTKLELLKSFLSLYFSFEQGSDKRKIAYKLNCEDAGILEEKYNKVIDYRYDVFFSTLLDKNLQLPSNLRIISWNYDMQLELAHNEFLLANSYEKSREKLRISYGANAKVIKLNGSAHDAISSENNHPYFLTEKGQLDLLKSILKAQEQRDSSSNLDYKSNLQFAWEKSDQKSKSIQTCKEILEQTKDLIIIGYSFPYFNRVIDQQIFGPSNIFNVKVQCLPSHFESIKQSLININFDLKGMIEYHNDLSQFYIPSELLI